MPLLRRVFAATAATLLVLAALPPAQARANGTGTVYAASARGTVIEYDPDNRAVVNEVPGVGAGPLVFSPSGNTIFIADAPGDRVIVFDVTDLRPLKPVSVTGGPEALAALPEQKTLYVGTRSGAVVAVDEGSLASGARADLGAPVIALCASPDQKQLAAVLGDGTLAYLSLPKLELQRRFKVEGTANAIVAEQRVTGSLRGGLLLSTRYWVATSEGLLLAYEPDGSRAARLGLGQPLQGLAIDGAARTLAVAGGNGILVTVDTLSQQVSGALQLKDAVSAVTIDPDGARVYAAMPTTGQLVTVLLPAMTLGVVLTSRDAPEHLQSAPLRLPRSRSGYTTLPHTGTRP